MSSYFDKAYHPQTGKLQDAFFLDNYFGHRRYGVKFADGSVWRSEEVRVPSRDAYLQQESGE